MKATKTRVNPLKTACKITFTAALALMTGVMASNATVTVQGWWHMDSVQPITDSSGNNRTFGQAYSTANTAGGAFVGTVVNNGAGGPLDSTGFSSTNCVKISLTASGAKAQSAMWSIGYNPPATNYGIEIWVLPQDNGIAGGSGGWILSSGQTGGVMLRINANGTDPSYIDAVLLGTSRTVGDQVPIDTNRWMHLAIVNDGGITTFYTNGVPCGASDTNHATASAGDVYCGTPSDNQAYFGYLDEARMFTFAPGAFSTNDLLLRPPGPNIITMPQSATVWNGGAATFLVNPSFDNSLGYQWQKGGAILASQTAINLYLNTVGAPDDGTTYECIVTGDSISRTTSVATLSIAAPNPANISAYRDTINAESTLVAYFPVDGDTATTASNTKDASHDGTLELGATFDGRTNTTFGVRSLGFNFDGDVTIPNNSAFEFPGGSGTIEAIVYLSQASGSAPTIFSDGVDGGTGPYYTVGASADGNSLIYTPDAGVTVLKWAVPGGLVGKLSHVAFVIDSAGANITAYANGQNLGTNTATGFGGTTGAPAWIGGLGTTTDSGRWGGTIDELAIYSSALTQGDIQLHYSKFFYGTNTAAPSITSQSGSKTILSGSSPTIVTTTTGTLPLSYSWTANGSPVAGATTGNLALSNVTATATYKLFVQNPYGTATSAPVVVTVTAPPSGYATVAMGDHPTAFWRLAETNGTTAVDSAGFNDATFSGGFTLGLPAFNGETGTGVKFDGSSGHAIAPQTPVLNPSGPFSIEFWASISAYGFYVPVGSMDRPARSGGYEFYLDGNYPGYEFHTAAGGGYAQIDGDNTVPPVGAWFHVVGVYDGVNIIEYVNGALANPDNTLPVTITPNLVGGFYIGSREENSHYFNGTISDVAFYNYALSPDQVASHYAVSYTPTIITTQPVGVTNTEGNSVTLSVVATGLPNSYQWVKDGVNLTDINNSDGSAHYPQDVTNSTLVISQSLPADSGVYKVVISNPLGGQTSSNATVLVVPDTSKPAVVSVATLGAPNFTGPTPYLIKVLFNKRMDPVSAGDLTRYSITPSVNISAVTLFGNPLESTLAADWREAILVTSGLTAGQKYNLTVAGVKDQAVTPNTLASSTTSFRAGVLTPNAVNWDYYYLGAGSVSTVDALTGDTNYPNAPQTNDAFTVFDSDQITGGDLNGNPAFGILGDNYGSVLSGWLTPTVSGQYTFFLASDDSSELDLSPDTTPSNAVMIASEPTCCHGFSEPGVGPYTSDPQTLVAGTSYFIRALHVEGGGGDYVKVAWRISTDSTAAADLNPIPGSFVSSYQPVPAPKFVSQSLVNGVFTLNWIGFQSILQESTDLLTWTPVAGNPNPLVVSVSAAPVKFYRLVQQ